MSPTRRGRLDFAPSFGQLVSFLVLAHTGVSALSQQYCSNQNTGSDYSAVSNNYQSNGACSTTCAGYAFAVVQGSKCWCSNYTPAAQSSTGDCSVQCPGYPYENCGDESSGLFGYVALGPSPSGTQGSSAASSSAQAPSSDSPTAVADQVTPSTTTATFIPATLSTSTTPPSSSTPTTSSTSTSSSSTWSPTPVTQIETVTGQVKTLTITPTTPPVAVQTIVKAQESNGNSFSQSPGKIAGVSIAVILVCAAIIGGLVWFCLRRRRQNGEALPISSTAGGDTPQRRPSRLSQMALVGTAPSSTANDSRSPPTIVTSGWGASAGNTNSTEKSPADTLDRRTSYPREVDQRLEPAALWNPLHDNGSHISVRSFRDDQDYSRRMLRIANPDTP